MDVGVTCDLLKWITDASATAPPGVGAPTPAPTQAQPTPSEEDIRQRIAARRAAAIQRAAAKRLADAAAIAVPEDEDWWDMSQD